MCSLPLYPHLTSHPPVPQLGLLRPRSRTMPRHLLTNSCHPLRPFCYHPTLTPLLLPIPLTPLPIPWFTSQLQRKSDWLLRSARVETGIDSNIKETRVPLKGVFRGHRCWGLPQWLLAIVDCVRGSRFHTRSAHSRVVQRLLEVQRSRVN